MRSDRPWKIVNRWHRLRFQGILGQPLPAPEEGAERAMPTTLNQDNLEQIQPVSQLPEPERKQRQRMVFALALLLVALAVVLFKDRQIMSPQTQETPVADQTSPPPTPATIATTQQSQTNPVTQTSTPSAPSKSRRAKTHVSRPEVKTEEPQPPSGPLITATNRTVLPPLDIEVVAGNQHRPVSSANNSVKIDMQSSASGSGLPAAQSQPVPDSEAQVSLPPATAERVTRSVKPDYPVLAKQMKVQGAVVLQALIDKGGKIQELHVVTGPSILAAAAQEAVKQWRFKPYYQRGTPVETEARITVNFTISTY